MIKIAEMLRNQKGATMVFLAMLLVIMLGVSALAVDYGKIYVAKAQLQTAADAAALAGAEQLPRFPSQADADAKDFANRNGVPEAQCTVTRTNNDTTITVTASRSVQLMFAPVFGKLFKWMTSDGSSPANTVTVKATATAQVSIANSVPWIVPFVLPKTQSFDYTKQFTMRMYGKDNPYFDPKKESAELQMDYMNVGIENTNMDQYIQYLKYGYQKTFTIGNDMQYLGPSSGGQASVDAFYDRTLRSNKSINEAKIGDPRIMLIPLVDSMLPRTTREGTKMKIVGFVAFFLDEVHREYSTKFWAKGRFIKDLNVGSGESTTNPAYDFGVRTTRLIK